MGSHWNKGKNGIRGKEKLFPTVARTWVNKRGRYSGLREEHTAASLIAIVQPGASTGCRWLVWSWELSWAEASQAERGGDGATGEPGGCSSPGASTLAAPPTASPLGGPAQLHPWIQPWGHPANTCPIHPTAVEVRAGRGAEEPF